MEKEVKKELYLGRGIHNKKFAELLMNGNLRQMLIAISNDKDLDVQIRKNYLRNNEVNPHLPKSLSLSCYKILNNKTL